MPQWFFKNIKPLNNISKRKETESKYRGKRKISSHYKSIFKDNIKAYFWGTWEKKNFEILSQSFCPLNDHEKKSQTRMKCKHLLAIEWPTFRTSEIFEKKKNSHTHRRQTNQHLCVAVPLQSIKLAKMFLAQIFFFYVFSQKAILAIFCEHCVPIQTIFKSYQVI